MFVCPGTSGTPCKRQFHWLLEVFTREHNTTIKLYIAFGNKTPSIPFLTSRSGIEGAFLRQSKDNLTVVPSYKNAKHLGNVPSYKNLFLFRISDRIRHYSLKSPTKQAVVECLWLTPYNFYSGNFSFFHTSCKQN